MAFPVPEMRAETPPGSRPPPPKPPSPHSCPKCKSSESPSRWAPDPKRTRRQCLFQRRSQGETADADAEGRPSAPSDPPASPARFNERAQLPGAVPCRSPLPRSPDPSHRPRRFPFVGPSRTLEIRRRHLGKGVRVIITESFSRWRLWSA